MVTHLLGSLRNSQIVPKPHCWFQWKPGHMTIPVTNSKKDPLGYILQKTALGYFNSNQNDSSRSEKLIKCNLCTLYSTLCTLHKTVHNALFMYVGCPTLSRSGSHISAPIWNIYKILSVFKSS